MIVSWNMKHLANPNKVARINEVNRLYGWPLMRIRTPKRADGRMKKENGIIPFAYVVAF